MIIRRYRPSDCGHMAELFYQTVHSVNAGLPPAYLRREAPGGEREKGPSSRQ